jgi:hypothetical protein
MKLSPSTRSWTWIGAVALVLTVAVMARRTAGGAKAQPEELRDAVASPASPIGARPMFSAGAFSRVPARPVESLISARLNRLADALDAKAASLRSAHPAP